MMQRYLIEIAYNGKRYHGWQIQPNAITIQKVLNTCLSKMLRFNVEVVGAGRTDSGVHAKQIFAHFDMRLEIDKTDSFLINLNSFLPKDVVVKSLRKVNFDFHARFDAISRTYQYWIIQKKNPFYENSAFLIHKKLNIKLMNKAAKKLLEYKDFSCFTKLDSQTKTNHCNIQKAFWEYKKDRLVFTIQANRFLRNMVRAIVGTLIDVGLEKKSFNEFIKIIKSKDRNKAGSSAPAHALYLVEVEYPNFDNE